MDIDKIYGIDKKSSNFNWDYWDHITLITFFKRYNFKYFTGMIALKYDY